MTNHACQIQDLLWDAANSYIWLPYFSGMNCDSRNMDYKKLKDNTGVDGLLQ